jgi:hypothetical protein
LNIERKKIQSMELTRKLYMNQGMAPTIDRPKPVNVESELFQWDNKCSALDAEWECLPYSQAMCEHLRGSDSYFQCVDDHFHACRRGAGCDYRGTPTPATCSPTTASSNLLFNEAVRLVCDDPSKEYASDRSYGACVDRMRDWVDSGCGKLNPNDVSGKVIGSSGW